jgi:putative CocE/NonD family hydrolase
LSRNGTPPEIRLLHDQRAPMRDGITLSTDVYLPRAPGPFPTILFRTPYESTSAYHIEWGSWCAAHGFAGVVQDCRGRYESEGVFYAYTDEAADGLDTLDWVAAQAWCTGKIGMWGRSYGALVQWQMAPTAHPNLTCLAPHVIPDDYFADYHYVGGAFQLALPIAALIVWSTNVELVLGRGSGALFNNRRVFSTLPLVDLDTESIGRRVPYWRDWLEHDRNDEYWRSISTIGRAGELDSIPTLQQGGWFDPYVRSAFRNWAGLTRNGGDASRHQVIIGPWSHDEAEGTKMGDLDFGPQAAVRMRDEEYRWFTYWLGDDDAKASVAAPDASPIRRFVMGRNEWRQSRTWPPEEIEVRPYYLHSGGRANSLAGDGSLSTEEPREEPADRFSYDPEDPVLTVGGVHSIHNMTAHAEVPVPAGPIDQRPLERRDDVLVYTTAPLAEELEVTGPVELVLYAASDGRDTDFTAKLVDVHPNGAAYLVTEGILRGRFRSGFDVPELLEPNEVAEYRIQLYPTSNVFRRGHCVRVDVSSSNFPRFARNLNTGESVATSKKIRIARQTVLHSASYPSHVKLPVVRS